MTAIKKVIRFGAVVLILLLVLAVAVFTVYEITMAMEWKNCKKELSKSFTYAENQGILSVTYQDRTTYIINIDQSWIYRELTTGMPVKHQDEPASDDVMLFTFGDGAELTVSRLAERRVQFHYVSGDAEFGFCMSDDASFDNLYSFVMRNR